MHTKKTYGFVYIWRDSKKSRPNRFYIGSHWGYENDRYICSSDWMRHSYKRHSETFKRRILKRIYTDRKDLLTEEQKWLNLIRDEELGKKYYNFDKQVLFNAWWLDPERAKTIKERISKSRKGQKLSEETKSKMRGRIVSSETKRKISKAKKGKPLWPNGRIFSKETKKKMSESQEGKILSEETKNKMSEVKIRNSYSLGVHPSEETKRKISTALNGKNTWSKGKHLSEETKQKISKSLIGNSYSLGVHPSEETRKKLRDRRIEFWVNKRSNHEPRKVG